MSRHSILFILFWALSSAAFAQGNLTAHVYENKTHIALSGVTVNNLNSSEIAITDEQGEFHIRAKKGDILVLKAFAYKTDSLLVISLRNQEIFLDPKPNELKEVNVTTTTVKNNVDYKDPDFRGQTMVFQRDAKGNYDGGVILRMWYWKKQDKKLKKEADRLKDEQTREEIFRVFNPGNLSQYLPLKGDDMDAFIIRYIPDVSVYSSPSFNLLVYLNSSYKAFNQLSPEEKKPQKLDQ